MQGNINSPFKDVVGLGVLQQEYLPSRRGKWVGLIFGLVCLAAAPTLALLAAFLGYNAFNNFGIRRVDEAVIGPLVLAGIALLIAVMALYSTWRGWNVAAALYEHGFAYRERGPVQQIRWNEIEAVWQAVTKHYTNGVYTGTTHTYTVQAANGQKAVLNDRLGKQVEVLGGAIQKASAVLLLPRYWSSLQLGEKVNFGPLALDREKLYAGKKELPWSEIKAIKIERGIISIKKDKGWFNWASATVPQIPNFFVFYELLGRFAMIE